VIFIAMWMDVSGEIPLAVMMETHYLAPSLPAYVMPLHWTVLVQLDLKVKRENLTL
jgi:hypothetical protein